MSEREARQPKAGRFRRLWSRVVGALILLPLVCAAVLLLLGLVYKTVTPPSTLMLGRWLTGGNATRVSVPLSEITPDLGLAVIASEDQRFCLHAGVDWGALQDVIDDDEGPSRGASTVTMQTAKNVFLWPGRSYLRKAIEIPLALALDALWGKRRVMEVYLNVAEWGDGVFGAEAAARHWFHKSAGELTRREAALLVVALPNPRLRNPARPTTRLKALAGRLSARMNAVASFAGCARAASAH